MNRHSILLLAFTLSLLSLNQADYAYDVTVNDSMAYVLGQYYFHVEDIKNIAEPVEKNTFEYNNRDLEIIDVSEPSSPVLLGLVKPRGSALSVCVENNFAYVAAGDSGLWIIDVSDASLLEEIGFFNKGGYVEEADEE